MQAEYQLAEVQKRASEEQHAYEEAVRTEELGGRFWWLWSPARKAISSALWACRATVKFFQPTALTLAKRNISALTEQVVSLHLHFPCHTLSVSACFGDPRGFGRAC